MDRGIHVSAHSPWVNHLLFVDDNFAKVTNAQILKNAKVTNAQRLNEVLRIMVTARDSVNREKS